MYDLRTGSCVLSKRLWQWVSAPKSVLGCGNAFCGVQRFKHEKDRCVGTDLWLFVAIIMCGGVLATVKLIEIHGLAQSGLFGFKPENDSGVLRYPFVG